MNWLMKPAPDLGSIRKAIAAVICLGVMSLPGAAQAQKLRFGNEGVYPPFSVMDSAGNLTGVEPDLAREMCKRLNQECEIFFMDFKALIPSLLQKRFDGIATQLSPTPERAERLEFTIPLFLNPGTFVVPKTSNFVFTKDGLKGKGLKLGVQRGSSMVKYSDAMLGDSVEYVFYDNPDQMKLDLLAGRINGVFDSKINWTLELIVKPEGKDWKIDGGDHWTGDPAIPVEKRGYSWAVRKGETELLARMNTVLAEIIKDCTYTAIRKKYLDIVTIPSEAHCS